MHEKIASFDMVMICHHHDQCDLIFCLIFIAMVTDSLSSESAGGDCEAEESSGSTPFFVQHLFYHHQAGGQLDLYKDA